MLQHNIDQFKKAVMLKHNLRGSCKKCWLLLGLAIVCATAAATVHAAGRVELIIAGESQVGADFHAWMELLGKAGADSVRLRAPTPTDRIGVEVQGAADRPVYVVTGALSPQGELTLPGARFRRSDAASLTRWIKDLAENGPAERREKRAAFGLTEAALEQVHRQLAQPLADATLGKTRLEVLSAAGRQLQTTLAVSAQQRELLQADPVAEELVGLSCGTALACVLRPVGLCFRPQSRGAQIGYAVVAADGGGEVWPVGWTPEKPPRDVLPALFDFLPVSIQNVSAKTALDAIGKRLQTPVLIDHSALARHGVDADKVNVSLKPGKSTYSLILQKVLFQARLKSEVRVDEADKPFLWITTLKPL